MEEVKKEISNETEPQTPNKEDIFKILTEEDYLKFIEETETGRKISDKLNTRYLQAYTGENGGQKKAIEKAVREAEEKIRKELQPEETPAEKRLRELEEKLMEKELKEQKRELQNIVNNNLAEKQLADAVVISEYLVGNDEEETEKRVEKFTTLISKLVEERVQKAIKDKFQESQTTAPNKPQAVNQVTKSIREMTGKEKIAFLAKQKIKEN